MNNPSHIPDSFSCQVLEFSGIIELLRQFLSGSISEPLLASVEPRTQLEGIRRDLERVGEAGEYLRQNTRPSLGSLKDPRPILDKLAVEGASCSALEILALVEVARAACDLRGLFSKTAFTCLDELMRRMADFRDLVAELDGKILPDGSVDSSASPALARIRRSIERLRHEVQSALERLLRRLSQDRVLQDAVVTIRNERFVLPVRAEEKRRIAGIIHGTSSSGATVYLEPMETVPLNNELVELQDREFAEIQRILAEFSDKLRRRSAELRMATGLLSELDLAFAKAEFAHQYDCCIPQLTDEFEVAGGRALWLKDVRHPLLEKTLRSQKRQSVPWTVELKAPKTLMVISGPNTGGKTIALKTVGIAALMAQAGLPVAANEVRLPLFGRVLADIGDLQSIEANLSTFSAHIKNIQSMVEVVGRNDLVLLDEIGASTDPQEGAALAVAILEHFRQRGAMTFVTTHQSRLKAYAAEAPETVNAAMDFDEATLQPTYRLLVGLPGKSSGLDMARRLGLEPSIVEKARTLLSPADAEASALVASIHEQKSHLEQDLQRVRQQQSELEAREAQLKQRFEVERRAKLRELDARLEETLRQFEKKWEGTVAEIRAQAETAKLGRRIERKAEAIEREVREEWNAQVLEALEEPAAGGEPVPGGAEGIDRQPVVGDSVRLAGLPTPGKVIGLLGDDQVEVEVGRLRMRVRTDKVRVLVRGASAGDAGDVGAGPRVCPGSDAAASRRSETAVTVASRQGSPYIENSPEVEVPAEINVIGSSAEEARERVDKFLDQAYVAGRFRLRIVHGHGKGILRKSLHEMFASHAHVDKFYPAPQHEGGAGATIVELKV